MNINILTNKKSNRLVGVEQILDDVKAGKMFILIDDEDRENEGDLIIPAQFATEQAINYMAKHARGLICLSITEQRAKELHLPLQPKFNSNFDSTAFTISIESKEGTTTGISVADRAKTIATAIDPNKNYKDIKTPGHVFPVIAKEGGALVRAGHTEASVDIAKLAGLQPAAVICEIMNDDGTMARLPDLLEYAEKHDMNILTIADLIAYRRERERLIEVYNSEKISYNGEGLELRIYHDIINREFHLSIIKGEIDAEKETLVRVHSHDVLNDTLKLFGSNAHNSLQNSLNLIASEERGVLVVICHTLGKSLEIFQGKNKGSMALRSYGTGAQILADIGVGKINLLTNNPVNPKGLGGYGLEIVGFKEL